MIAIYLASERILSIAGGRREWNRLLQGAPLVFSRGPVFGVADDAFVDVYVYDDGRDYGERLEMEIAEKKEGGYVVEWFYYPIYDGRSPPYWCVLHLASLFETDGCTVHDIAARAQCRPWYEADWMAQLFIEYFPALREKYISLVQKLSF